MEFHYIQVFSSVSVFCGEHRMVEQEFRLICQARFFRAWFFHAWWSKQVPAGCSGYPGKVAGSVKY